MWSVFDAFDVDLELLRVFRRCVVLDGSGFIGCCLVGFLGGFELVDLLLNDIVFNLFKQQRGLAQLLACLKQIARTELFPVQ